MGEQDDGESPQSGGQPTGGEAGGGEPQEGDQPRPSSEQETELQAALADMGAEEETIAADEGESPGEDTPSETPESEAAGEASEQPSPESGEGDEPSGEGDHAPEYVRWSADGDPENSYRDAQGRLHDAESGEYMQGETVDPPEEVKAAAEVTDEDAEDFFGDEEEPEEPPVDPVEIEGEDGETLELVPQDEETRDLIAEMKERAEQADSLAEENESLREDRTEVQELQDELSATIEGIQEDPSGFIVDHLDPEPETQQRLALDLLLLNDDVFEAVTAKVNEWQMDGSKRREARVDRREDFLERRQERSQRRGRRSRARQIMDRVDAIVPETVERGSRDKAIDDVLREVEAEVQRRAEESPDGTVDLTPEEVTELEGVRDRLRLYGINPDTVQANGSGRDRSGSHETSESSVETAEPAGEQERSLAERAEEARRVGVALRKRHEKREDAASSTPSGAGPTPSRRDVSDKNLDEVLSELG